MLLAIYPLWGIISLNKLFLKLFSWPHQSQKQEWELKSIAAALFTQPPASISRERMCIISFMVCLQFKSKFIASARLGSLCSIPFVHVKSPTQRRAHIILHCSSCMQTHNLSVCWCTQKKSWCWCVHTSQHLCKSNDLFPVWIGWDGEKWNQ